jgi:putative NADH-flavin reductase
MRIALFGGTGRTGRYILDAALAGGDAVTVLARNPSKLPPGKYRLTIQLGDVLDGDTVDDTIFGQDVVISALGLSDPAKPKALSTGIANIIRAMRTHSRSRIVVIAGAGVLDDPNTGGLRIENPNYPAMFRPYGEEHRRVYDLLRATNLEWTMVCPPSMRDEPPTGNVRIEENRMPAGGKSITYADVANFAYSLLGSGGYIRQRVGIAD